MKQDVGWSILIVFRSNISGSGLSFVLVFFQRHLMGIFWQIFSLERLALGSPSLQDMMNGWFPFAKDFFSFFRHIPSWADVKAGSMAEAAAVVRCRRLARCRAETRKRTEGPAGLKNWSEAGEVRENLFRGAPAVKPGRPGADRG